jgi:hypothetical protein
MMMGERSANAMMGTFQKEKARSVAGGLGIGGWIRRR